MSKFLKRFSVGLSVVALGFAPTLASAQGAVDAQEQKVLDAYQAMKPKPFHTVTPKEARKGPTLKQAVLKVAKDEKKKPDDSVKSSDKKIKVASGSLPVRVYTPKGAKGMLPVVLYFHGGGFVVADKDVYDAGPRMLSKDAHALVISVDYRQAPENPFPAAADDATAAFEYVKEHAKEWNGDASRIAVAGESAGGNLATVVCMREKASNKPLPNFQLLVYPFLSTDTKSPSHVANGQGQYLVGNEDIAWFWKNYLGENWEQSKDVNALPSLATPAQLKGLPPAFIITAGLDPLKDEGQAYAAKLKAAGVTADVKNYDGVTHEFYGMGLVVDVARTAEQDAATAVSKALGGGAPAE